VSSLRESGLASVNQHGPETDDLFPAPKRHETEAILQDMDVPYQITLYSDVDHGFALKADLSRPRIKFATESAFLQAVNWFNEFLKTK
jgi:dienelactone hydrolase